MIFYLFVVLLILLVIFDRRKPEKLKKLHEQLGCEFFYLPIIGHSHIFCGGERRVRTYMNIARQCYKNRYGMTSFWVVNRLFVGISDPLQARIVLKTCLDKGINNLTIDVLGNLSAFAPVEKWRPRRKIITAVFAPKFLKNFIEIFLKHSRELCDELSNKAFKGDFSTNDLFFDYTINTICETATGQIKKKCMDDKHHPVRKLIEESMENLMKRIAQPWKQIDSIYKLTADYQRQIKNRETIRTFLTELISTKKALVKTEQSGTSENKEQNLNKKTLVDLFMEFSGDNDITNTEMLEDLVLLTIASTDTTTITAGFICVVLSWYPDVQEKAYEEYHCMEGGMTEWPRNLYRQLKRPWSIVTVKYCLRINKVFKDQNIEVNLKDLDKLQYTEAIIKEVIRLYPSGPMILRLCDKDIELHNGITLSKDTVCLINILGINRNPYYWGMDAEVFRPERFLEGAPSHPAALMSFSYGPRNCIGQNFAMISLKILFLNILRRYCITPATCYNNAKKEKITADVMIRPNNDFKVKINPRH